MLLSMTGFGKSTVEIPGKKITIELKSLNSKQFDMQSRVPSVYRELELEMRKIVSSQLERGKVDMVVSIENIDELQISTSIDIEAAKVYKSQFEQMQKALQLPEPSDWYTLLLRMPDVLKTDVRNEIAEDETSSVLAGLNAAIYNLMEHRRCEGIKLEEFFTQRIQAISEMLNEVPQWEKERIDKIYARLEDSLSQIPQVQYGKGRLEQEMIFYIEKLDVNEEKQRLSQHLAYFLETMNLPKAGQGKKLGFIAQEMGREINTLGSKSNHASMQQLVVRMKDELEQIKEQVLNVM